MDIDDNLKKADIGDPLPLKGVAIDNKLRLKTVLKLVKSLKGALERITTDAASRDLLVLALALTLEQYIAHATVPHTKEGYEGAIKSMQAELKVCEDNAVANDSGEEFAELTYDFAKEAEKIARAPVSPSVKTGNVNTSQPASGQSQPATGQEQAKIEITEQERKALEPQKSSSIASKSLSPIVRRQGLAYMFTHRAMSDI